MAWTQGVDFYGVAGNRMAFGFEYASKYMLGDYVPVYGNISARERNSLRDIYEAVYNHYHFIKHINMPYTRRMISRTRPNTSQVLLVSLRTPANSNHQFTDLPRPGNRPLRVGAVGAATTAATQTAVRVAPGQSVQLALDTCKKGAWIILLKGIHQLDSALQIPSDITLSGEGQSSILFLAPGARGPAMINKTTDMHNLTIRDLLIEGAVKTTESDDPNDNRRTRAYQNAPARSGIIFVGNTDTIMDNINLCHVTVHNCTQTGVDIVGASNVVIEACDFSDNGSNLVPGPGQYHNLHLFHVSKGKIINCRLDTSPCGNGLTVAASRAMKILDNETARNKINGITCADVSDLRISGNFSEGNDADGIFTGRWFDGSMGIIENNTCQNNGKSGIAITGKHITVQRNRLVDNKSNVIYETTAK